MQKKRVTLLGSGAWAFALSQALVDVEVRMYSIEKEVIASLRNNQTHPRFPIVKVVNPLEVHENLQTAIEGADWIIESVTSQGFPAILQQLKNLGCTTPILITSKGINIEGQTLYEVACKSDYRSVAVLSGATFADEVLARLATCATIAAEDQKLACGFQALFDASFFHTEISNTPVACMLGGAVKNVYAILCGVLDGLGYGKNARAALITKAYREMQELLMWKHLHKDALQGYSGLADLILTCTSEKSRNFQCGMNIAHGMSPEESRGSVGMIVEGAFAAKALAHVIRLPIAEMVYKILYENYPVDRGVREIF